MWYKRSARVNSKGLPPSSVTGSDLPILSAWVPSKGAARIWMGLSPPLSSAPSSFKDEARLQHSSKGVRLTLGAPPPFLYSAFPSHFYSPHPFLFSEPQILGGNDLEQLRGEPLPIGFCLYLNLDEGIRMLNLTMDFCLSS